MSAASIPAPEVRNLQFPIDARIPRFWHGGRKSVTLFMNNLSVFFPAGERFFIASVKAHREVLTDPALAAAARVFYAQEGMHTREHVRYNAMLREQGYPVDDMERRVERILDWVSRENDASIPLGVTCALEHFTALIADTILRDPRFLEGAHPEMRRLWRWHAVEEAEHKGVPFDVAKAAGLSYGDRAATMLGATFIFWGKVFEHQLRLMHHEKILFSAKEWLSLLHFLFVRPGWFQRMLPTWLAYFRPSFHPWDHDNRDLIEAWKRDPDNGAAYARVA